MVKISQYEKNFLPHSVPPSIAKLVAFEAKQDGFFSSGFELAVDDKSGIKTWCDEAEFLSALFPIGAANGSGSTYALWLAQGEDLENAPVVVFGDEGGVHVVAENVRSLLRILTFDSEPMIDHDEVSFYKDEDDHEPSDGAEEYVAWLLKEFELKPVESEQEVDKLVTAAQKKYSTLFATWMKKYYEA
jgi:hypothetical protein